MADTTLMDKLVSLCKRRGFVFQSSEVYGGDPGRITATLVGGVCRYEKSDDEKGGFEWHELIAAASRARGRLLHEAAPDAAARPITAAQ